VIRPLFFVLVGLILAVLAAALLALATVEEWAPASTPTPSPITPWET
jgi:hypothetical protein